MPYQEYDGDLDGEEKKPAAAAYVEFDGELDEPKKPGLVERVTGAAKSVRDTLASAPDPLREKVNAGKRARDPNGVMAGMDGAMPAPAPAADKAAPYKPAGLFADLKTTDVLPTVTARAQETRDMIDPSAEARTRRLTGQGMNVDQAKHVGKWASANGVLPGQEGGASRMEATDVDFETRRAFNEDPVLSNPVVRGAVKGYQGYKQGSLGLGQFAAEVAGADEFAGDMAAGAKKSRDFAEAMGAPTGHLQRNFEGAVSSIATQLPALVGAAATGSGSVALASMFAQSFGSEYGDGRARGQDPMEATKRAGLFATFEVVGERLGLGQQIQLLRNSARGVETNVLAKWMANTLTKELPGEMVTTTGQFLTDKLGGGVGLNTEAGLASYLDQMADTATQTIMQGGVMGAATSGANQARSYMRDGFGNAAEYDAEDARRAALERWNTNGLTSGARANRASTWAEATATPDAAVPTTAPAAPVRREPTLSDIGNAETVDDAIRAAADLVAAPTSAARADLPTSADIDALEDTYAEPAAAVDPDGIPLAGLAGDTGPDGGLEPIDGAARGTLDGSGAQAPADAALAAGVGGNAVPAADPAADGPAAVVDSGIPTSATPDMGIPASAADDSADWFAFPESTGTLAIPRAEMPQIASTARGALTQFLGARGVTHEQIEVDAAELKPTQAEFSMSKVQAAKDYQGGNRSILVSSDGHVLDGHHQWLAAVEDGQPVKAIRLSAPIAELVKLAHEFPSSTVSQEGNADVSESPQVPEEAPAQAGAQGAQPAAPGARIETSGAAPAAQGDAAAAVDAAPVLGQGAKLGQSKLEQRRALNDKQDDVVRQAAINNEKRKLTGGQAARERVAKENPLLAFLGEHGINLDERSDTGGEKRKNAMLPGFGPIYRRSGKRIDELAALAVEAGFLTSQDVEDASDNGGTRKLADLIQRAVHGKEIIGRAASEPVVADADQQLIEQAERMGIEVKGKSVDDLYDEVAEQFSRAEAALADEIFDDIPLEGGTAASDNLNDEDLDAIFGAQSSSAQVAARQTQEDSASPAPGRDPRAEEAGSRGEVKDTRGTGVRFHGTSRAMPGGRPNNEYAMSGDNRNIYGQGFYTTDAADISEGYMRKGKGGAPTLYEITERGDIKLYDMEQPMSADVRAMAERAMGDEFPTEDIDGKPITTLRELFDEYRGESANNGLTRDEVQETFDAIRYNLEQQGYKGYRHIGGLKTKKAPHDVRIYWAPEDDIDVEQSSLDQYRGEDPALSSYSAADVVARQQAEEEVGKRLQADKARLESAARKEAERRDIDARMDASADNFQLGQSADDALSGQEGLRFSVAGDTTIPASFYSTFTVDHNGQSMSASQALDAVREDIDTYRAMIACMKG